MIRGTLTQKLAPLFVFAALGMAPASSIAQDFPAKTVRIVAPFQTGGAGSLVARIVAEALAEKWGKPVIVDNRPGAGTIVGTEIVARSPADGYTLLLNTGAFVINTSLRPALPYDAFKDFAPVTLLVSTPIVLVVNSSSSAKSLREFVEEARAHPGTLSYGSAGPGTNNHLVGEMLKAAAALDIVYAPYPGTSPAVTALLGNHVGMVIATYAEVASQVAAGKLRILAVASPERVERLPAVPTISESGYPDVQGTVWYGIVAPAGTPPKAIARIQADVASVLKLPGIRDKLVAQEMKPIGSTPEEFNAFMRTSSQKFQKVIRAAGIKAE